jgi:urease accessory protein UreH
MPPDDPGAPIVAAARRRHELTRAKAVQALRELHAAHTPVTFQAVADAAGVSRSWLYAQPDIRRDIEQLRATSPTPARPAVTAIQRCADASLAARLAAANQRLRELSEDNQRLRRQLAHALADQRATRPPRIQPGGNTPTTIRPLKP